MTSSTWFETKVKYDKVLENGTCKKVLETYLVAACTFTQAEARIVEEMTTFISGEFEVSAVKREHISEIFTDPNGDKWYRAKVMFITIDEKSGAEKYSTSTMIVQAKDFNTALENLQNGMKGTISDWMCHTIAESPIIDIYN